MHGLHRPGPQEIDRMVEEGADMDEIAAKLEESAPGLTPHACSTEGLRRD
jgi:hypothetical protein